MDEIRLMYNAHVYGDVEPLLECLQSHGLQQQQARKFVADLARGKKPRAERNLERDERDYRIRAMVANQRGLLKREGRDPRRAISVVTNELHCKGVEIDRKQITRIWKHRHASPRIPSYFGSFYQAGLDGFKIRI